MPIYEFQCDACGEGFEVLLKSTRERIKPECPSCKSKQIHKKFSAFGMNTGGSRSGDGAGSSSSSGCATCRASSCANCKK